MLGYLNYYSKCIAGLCWIVGAHFPHGQHVQSSPCPWMAPDLALHGHPTTILILTRAAYYLCKTWVGWLVGIEGPWMIHFQLYQEFFMRGAIVVYFVAMLVKWQVTYMWNEQMYILGDLQRNLHFLLTFRVLSYWVNCNNLWWSLP